MNSNSGTSVKEHLRAHWMAWLSLHHLLSASALRELVQTVVLEASRGSVQYEDLFEEVAPQEPLWSETWIMRLRDVEGRYASYLQSMIRSLLWRNDETNWSNREDDANEGAVRAETIEQVLAIGRGDFVWPRNWLEEFNASGEEFQSSLRLLLNSLQVASSAAESLSDGDFWSAAGEQIEAIDLPLRALAIKHIADLCADADNWSRALVGYQRAQSMLTAWEAPQEWQELTRAWLGILHHSRASATRILLGPGEAFAAIAEAGFGRKLGSDPLGVANASYDEFIFRLHPRPDGRERQYVDSRVVILRSPLLFDSDSDGQAVRYWTRGDFGDAHRRFWAALRRQISLGETVTSREVKSRYARCIFDDLEQSWPDAPIERERFLMAAKLLVESGNAHAVKEVRWSEGFLEAYLDESVLSHLAKQTGAFVGCRLERSQVLIQLFCAWVCALSPTEGIHSVGMWKHIAHLARDFRSAFESQVDVGKRALKALKEMAKRRPELRRQVANDVCVAICKRLTLEEFWAGSSEALETAQEYVDVLDGESIENVAEATLMLLEGVEPGHLMWPLARAALEFLVEEAVLVQCSSAPKMKRRIFEQVLRFGIEQEGEHSRLFFYLHRFDPELLHDPAIRLKAEEPIKRVRHGANEINSSNCTECVYALILGAGLVGYEGLKDALESFLKILETGAGKQRSIGLAHAYDVLFLLDRSEEMLRKELSDKPEWFDGMLHEIMNSVLRLWGRAAVDPLVFAPFAIPRPTRPNPTVVHNWAMASVWFAKKRNRLDEMDRALKAAASQADLGESIALAKAGVPFSVGQVDRAKESRETFYTSLGRQLARLHVAPDESVRSLASALVKNCLLFGPRALDAAVLLEAKRLGLSKELSTSDLDDYKRRISVDRDLRLTLFPILGLFEADGTADGD